MGSLFHSYPLEGRSNCQLSVLHAGELARILHVTVRRLKTYVAETGYVYQYYFVGKRPALDNSSATEYVFDVNSDRRTTFAVSVFILPAALAHWSAQNGRDLSDTEQYAAAKLRLLQGFDEHSDMFAQGRQLLVDANNIDVLLEPLGLA